MPVFPEKPPADVRQLTLGIARGDDEAFNRFYEDYADRLHRYLLVLTKGADDLVQDIFQETMLRVVRYMKPFERADVFWHWLTRLARTALIDLMRKSRRHRTAYALPAEELMPAVPDEGHANALLLKRLDEALLDLEGADRELLARRYFEGMSLAALADERNTSAKALESKMARLRATVRKKLLERLTDERA